MSYQAELDAWQKERMRILALDIQHLERVVASHIGVTLEEGTDAAERNYAFMSAARSQKALDQKRELFQQYVEATNG